MSLSDEKMKNVAHALYFGVHQRRCPVEHGRVTGSGIDVRYECDFDRASVTVYQGGSAFAYEQGRCLEWFDMATDERMDRFREELARLQKGGDIIPSAAP